ncbi:MAG TPA: YigZ family protein [Clostridia bacterium]|nr:YigZ family protein [Clostridia bacterium]
MQDAGYLTVKGYGESEIVIEKSRFIAQVDRAANEEEAKAFVQRIKKRHWNATHNCSAYVIGEGNGVQKANDDGEPGGTAGVPILEVLLKKGLRDTVVVVTRYFGGIKLGAGGLIRAYGRAAAEGIESAGIVKRSLMRSMTAGFDYTWLGKIENELAASPYVLKETRYSDRVEMDILVPMGEEDAFASWVAGLTNGQAEIKEGEAGYVETEI